VREIRTLRGRMSRTLPHPLPTAPHRPTTPSLDAALSAHRAFPGTFRREVTTP